MNKSQPSLEDSLQEISTIINQMEQGDLTLEQSLACFERGVGLIKTCQAMLAAAEHKVQVLLQNSDDLTDLAALKNDAEHDGV